MAKKQIITEVLAEYADRIEREAQPLAVCQITHPDAVDGSIYEGTYAGIRLVNGATPSATLSDGSTIPPSAAPKAAVEIVETVAPEVEPVISDQAVEVVAPAEGA